MDLTPDVSDRKNFHKSDFSNALKPSLNPVLKSPLRIRYLAEVEVLKKELGSLDQVRLAMGLSRRKICQELLVDPSAWTRWMKDEAKVPPHIWKMLSMMSKKTPPTILHDQLRRELEIVRFSLGKAEKRLRFGAFFLFLSLFLSGTIIILFAFR